MNTVINHLKRGHVNQLKELYENLVDKGKEE